MNSYPILLLLLVLATSSPAQSKRTHRTWLRQYAYCRCFSYATGDSLYFRDVDISLGVSWELAGYEEHVYDTLDRMAKQKAKLILPSTFGDHENKKAILMDCLDFFESKELRTFVRSCDKYRIKIWAH